MNLRLHHVGMLVADIDKEMRTYEKRFGYDALGATIHDPAQTAYVQFMKLPQDRACLELISPDGPASKLSSALTNRVGLHHLCYATDALDQTCAELRKKGMTLIEAPLSAPAFRGRRIAWLMGRDRILIELVEQGSGDELP